MGGTMISKAKVRESSVSAVVTRANGRVENFGVVSYYSRNPLKRWAVNAWIKMKELRR
jgi:hypothetical protein